MKVRTLLITGIICGSYIAHVEAAPLALESGRSIYDGASPLQVDSTSAPTVADWNNDGRKDLIVGQFTLGRIWLYLNQGTDANPVFDGGTMIKSGSTPISTSYG